MENEDKARKFITEVLRNMVVDPSTKERIEKDLYCHIMEAAENVDIDTFLQQMGSPQEVASEFMQNIYDSDSDLVQKLVQDKKIPPHHPAPPPHPLHHLHPPHHPDPASHPTPPPPHLKTVKPPMHPVSPPEEANREVPED